MQNRSSEMGVNICLVREYMQCNKRAKLKEQQCSRKRQWSNALEGVIEIILFKKWQDSCVEVKKGVNKGIQQTNSSSSSIGRTNTKQRK